MNRLFSDNDLKKLILPLILEQALAITVGMADTMMVASAGEAAVSGVSLVDMINMLMFSIFSALATGGAVVTSQLIGARQDAEARNSAKQLLFTITIIGILVMIAVMTARQPIFRLFFGSVEADVMNNALIYLMITAMSFPFFAIYNACAALFRSMGNSNITFNTSVLINLVNVVGNAVCIFILHMGVAGVAIPTLISRMLGAMILYALLKQPCRPIYFEKGKFQIDISMIARILHIGIPSGIENGIFQLGRVLVVSIISGFGTIQIAANGVANNLDSVGIIIGSSMNLAIITVIGQCVGARDEQQVRYYTRKLLLIEYVASAILITLVLLNLDWILGWYGLSSETTQLAKTLIIIHCGCAIFLWPIAFTLPNMLRACNDVQFPMVCSILSMFIFRIGSSYILGVHMGMGAVGVWIAMILDWICRITCFTIRYFRGKWRFLANLT
ncbi:MAG: MATE family efflux transporter [Brotaphodocola sp.]